ncbi:MAG: hypothetical protein NC927_01390, partial [Candidatus Omnitrophica bacterium]|nr:hypothetical protein [Candidatus Omnitrophota bacterium]
RLGIEMALIKISQREELSSLEDLMRRIEEFKRNILPEKKEDSVSSQETKPTIADKPSLQKVSSGNIDSIKEIKKGTFENTDKKKITFEEIRAIWDSFVEEIKKLKMSLGLYLSEATLVSLQGDVLTLGFAKDKNLHKETLEKISTRQLIEKELQKITHSFIKLEFTILKEESSNQSLEATNSDNTNDKTSFENTAPNDPLIEKVMKTFGGTLKKGEEIDLS